MFSVAAGFFDGARLLFSDVPIELETSTEQQEIDAAPEEKDEVVEAEGGTLSMKKWTCGTCKLKFDTGDEQRSHFKSDFHRLNVKRKLAGKPCLDEEAFERFVDGNRDEESDVSSISGSDTDSDEDENRRVPRKLGRQIPILLKNGSVAQVWRCVLMSDKEKLDENNVPAAGNVSIITEEQLISRLKDLTRPSENTQKTTWVVLLSIGGHFAGLVMDMKSNVVQAHQTYHRYVVRAKAGGKQTTRDATGRAPKSAGASLRRYNEMALQKEIKGLLQSWRSYFADASGIFVFAPSRNNQSLFGEDPLLNRQDPRIRSVPFPTKRPTLKEAKRVCTLLASLPLKNKEEVILNTPIAETQVKEVAKPKPKRTEAATQSRNVEVVEETSPSEVLTPLHEASIAGNTAFVLSLLEQGADPCVKARGRTPYTAAPDKDTRNVFRKFMAAHPDKWDWHVANVPSPLTDEQEAAQIAKQEEKTAKRKAKEKQRRKERKAQLKAEEAKEKEAAIAKKLQAEEEARMAPLRERELRAAAAEARMRGCLDSTSTETCTQCRKSLANQVPFSKFSYKYCSVPCVNAHRKAMEEEN